MANSAPIEIILTSSNMSFLLYNLFGHDIVHDAHVGGKLGYDRNVETISSGTLSESSKSALSTAHVGGRHKIQKGGEDADENISSENLDDLFFLEEDSNETITDNSKKNIIYSVGKELISKRILYGKQDRLRSDNKKWQNKTFIIIDIPIIVNQYVKKTGSTRKPPFEAFSKEVVTYPGSIYYNGKIINPLDINVSVVDEKSLNPNFEVKWMDDTPTYYKLNFNSNIKLESESSADKNFIDTLTITEFSDEYISKVEEIILEIICNKEDTGICEKFEEYVENLGDDFFYGAFTDYMRNETYNIIEGKNEFFVQYIFSKEKNSNYLDDMEQIRKFFKFIIDSKDLSLVSYKILYDYFKTNYEVYNNIKLSEFDNSDSSEKNDYIIVLAKLFGLYINLYISSPDLIETLNEQQLRFRKGMMTIYIEKIKPFLKLFTCDSTIMKFQNFLRVCTLFMDLNILNQDYYNKYRSVAVKTGGGKKYNQSGGAYINSIMTNDEKKALLVFEAYDSAAGKGTTYLIPSKWNKFIKEPIGTFDGEEATSINDYINNIKVPPNQSKLLPPLADNPSFYYQNILNLNLTLTLPNMKDYIVKVSDAKFSLYNTKTLSNTFDFIDSINVMITQKTFALNKLDKMPNTGNKDITPIFLEIVNNDSKLLEELNKIDSLKLETPDIKNDIKGTIQNLYKFEQAFIVQLKVFLFYAYTKKIQEGKSNQADSIANSLAEYLTDPQRSTFLTNFKTNLTNYLKIINEIKKIEFDKLSAIQKVNSGYIVSSSIGVISYCLKEITDTTPNLLLTAETDMLNSIYLKSNLLKAGAAGSVDEELLEKFKEYIQMPSAGSFSGAKYRIKDTFDVDDDIQVKDNGEWKSGKITKVNTKDKSVGSGKNKHTIKVIDEEKYEVKIGNAKSVIKKKGELKFNIQIGDLIKNKPTDAKQLYYINNAVSYSEVPNYFCPFSSIMDGQSTCSTYKTAITPSGNSNPHPVEEGIINVIIRNGISSSTSTGETMRYHVRVEKSKKSNGWVSNDDGAKFVEISAYLKIKDNVLINVGFEDNPSYKHTLKTDPTKEDPDKIRQPAIEVNLNSSDSPLDAKKCIKSMMETAIELLSNNINGNSFKKWDDYLNIINGTTTGDSQTSNGNKSSAFFRKKIMEASFKKSLGDFLQEINTVAVNGGYIKDWASKDTQNLSVTDPKNSIRLGLSNDRPSGVRAAFLILFGLSGINPNAIGGFVNPTGSYTLAARQGSNWKGGGIIENHKILTKNKNNTKRYKNKTKKRKILLKKNRKLSKRNNKGTKKKNK